MISPFKAALGVNYKDFEDRLENAIHTRFGLPAKTPVLVKKLIKQADRACAFFEATQLAGFTHAESLAFFDAPPAGYSPEDRARSRRPRPSCATSSVSTSCRRRPATPAVAAAFDTE